MNFAGFLKQLKKKLRRKRRFLSLGALLLVVGCLSVAAWIYRDAGKPALAPDLTAMAQENPDLPPRRYVVEALKQKPVDRPVVLHKVYICGEESETLGKLSTNDLLKLLRDHPDWEAEISADGSVELRQQIDDLSEKCKQSAYFGIDDEGNLSLYEGLPALRQTIRTFFQLDVKMLESSLPTGTVKQLETGIRIQDVDEYNSVLSTFSYYAIDETAEVLRQSN